MVTQQVIKCFADAEPPGTGQLLALVDSLREGTLNQAQAETVRQLRAGILALSEREKTIHVVKVQVDSS